CSLMFSVRSSRFGGRRFRARDQLALVEVSLLQSFAYLSQVKLALVLDVKRNFPVGHVRHDRVLLYPRKSVECSAHSGGSAAGSGHARDLDGDDRQAFIELALLATGLVAAAGKGQPDQ